MKAQKIYIPWNKGKTKKDYPQLAFSEEAKKKMSIALKGKNAGKDNPFYGKHHSEETKQKMSESQTRKRKCKGKLKIDHKCIKCGKIRSIQASTVNRPTFTGLCSTCNMKKSSSEYKKIKRNRTVAERPFTKNGDGYLEVVLPHYHWLYPYANKHNHQVYVHRLVMAEHLGRPLEKGEIVHHINGDREDNRMENLELTTTKMHLMSYRNGYNRGFQAGYEAAMQLKNIDEKEQVELLTSEITNLKNGLVKSQNSHYHGV